MIHSPVHQAKVIIELMLAMIISSSTVARAAPPVIRFASVEEGKGALRQVDDFVSRMSAFDRSIRLKKSGEITRETYLDFVATQVQPWNQSSQQTVGKAIGSISTEINDLKQTWPKEVLIIHTTGLEEGDAPYTRGTNIILPESAINEGPDQLAGTLAHELFHILSRHRPALREKLYALIGFTKCAEVVLPPSIAPRRITNPDAPIFDHCIKVTAGGMEQRVVPVLLATVETYPVTDAKEFFDYLSLSFWPLDKPASVGQPPLLYSLKDLQGFFEQVGRNTGYIIHPEEALADNFKLMVMKEKGLPSPEIIEKLRTTLLANGED